MTKVNLFWLCQSNCGRSQPQTRVMRITHNVALNFHPIFIPLNQLFGAILDFEGIKVGSLFKNNKAKESIIFTTSASG
jgi:hypothetical protein